MASGIPLVTTRVGQAQEIVVHGTNGWMVDVGDAEALAEWVYSAPGRSRADRSHSGTSDRRAICAHVSRHSVGSASRGLCRAHDHVRRVPPVRRIVPALARRVPRAPFRYVMPWWAWRPLFTFWLSVVRAGADRRRAVRNLLELYDALYREVDLAAIAYEDGVHPKHRLTRYHDFRRSCAAWRDRARHWIRKGRAGVRPRAAQWCGCHRHRPRPRSCRVCAHTLCP